VNETRPIPAPLVSLPFTECSEDDKEVGERIPFTLHPLHATTGRVHEGTFTTSYRSE